MDKINHNRKPYEKRGDLNIFKLNLDPAKFKNIFEINE